MSRANYLLKENKEAEVKIISPEKCQFKLDFKAYGKNLFQHLVLTVNAYNINDEDQMNPIPIKCVWKRVRNETQIYIQETSSNSYIPTAEDIGYLIEVEVTAIDMKLKQTCLAQYGPIYMTSDVKNSLEMILGQGEAKFSCYLYSIEEQAKIPDKQLELIINWQELKILELKQDSNEVIESIKYNTNNPLIQLHHLDSTRFSLKFLETLVVGKESKIKQEYNLSLQHDTIEILNFMNVSLSKPIVYCL